MNSPQSEQTPQESEQKISAQQLFLIGLLGVVFIIVLVISILILTRPQSTVQGTPIDQQEIVFSSETIPSLTATLTITPSPIFTFTPKPTRTPTIAPTSTASPSPTLLPSLTLAFPSEHNDQYYLVLWTPELATSLIDLLEVYPETLSSFARGADNQGYFDAFQYALFAQQEALLQFPTAPQADDWLWQLAYNLARTSDPSAGDVYASIITQELNRGNTTLDDLYTWGWKQSPQILIESFPLDSEDVNLGSSLIKVTAGDNGSSYFWLIEEVNGYSSYSLTSGFDFIKPNQIENFMVDFLGTNNKVVGIFQSQVYDSLHYIIPRVFSLLQQPPEELTFALFSPPAIGPDFTNTWQPIETKNAIGDLKFSDVVFPACPVTVEHPYKWNGLEFTFIEDTYQINPDSELLSYCEMVVNHSANVWGLEPTIQLMETLLPVWPPEITTTGKDYPDDALDEWRYRLSIYHALLANQDQAVDYAQLILDDPASPDSRWIAPAAEFLAIYQIQRDIYRACLQAQYCDPRLAFQSLMATITTQEYPDLINTIEQAGVTVRSNGFFDFENDGESEQWVVIRHHTGSPLEFWIISPNESHLQTVFVSTLETDNPRLSYLEPISEPPIVQIDPDITFHYIKLDPEEEPVIVLVEPEVIFSSDRTEMDLDNLEEILLTGGDPAFVQEELIVLSKSPHFTCSYLLCPRFLYLLGLASELANDELSAVAAYLDLWRQYPAHPYTIMARFKLGSTYNPTPTVLPTISNTPTHTPDGLATPTPGNTETPEAYPPPGYPEPGITPTSTTPGFPYPTP
ncbi:MAG: hypothetical protein MUO57_17845 [Anaerolineales bacterium]|nr:hypothetical protein [Anaerolineales bacterium]